jgi:hypothetical protein
MRVKWADVSWFLSDKDLAERYNKTVAYVRRMRKKYEEGGFYNDVTRNA